MLCFRNAMTAVLMNSQQPCLPARHTKSSRPKFLCSRRIVLYDPAHAKELLKISISWERKNQIFIQNVTTFRLCMQPMPQIRVHTGSTNLI